MADASDILRRDLIKRAEGDDTEALVNLGEFYPELGEIFMRYADVLEMYDALTQKHENGGTFVHVAVRAEAQDEEQNPKRGEN